LGKYWRVLQWKMLVLFGHLVNFPSTWHILWPFGIFSPLLVHFTWFGMLYQEKSGNPDVSSSRAAVTKPFGDSIRRNELWTCRGWPQILTQKNTCIIFLVLNLHKFCSSSYFILCTPILMASIITESLSLPSKIGF
jgi:hypothetical protein